MIQETAVKTRVLIVDDNAVIRRILRDGLSREPDLEVVGEAPDPFVARDLIVKLRPDVLTLDVEMPRMNGVEFLRKLMPQYPLPVVMVSSLTRRGRSITLEALELGAIDYVEKPDGMHGSADDMMEALIARVRVAAQTDIQQMLTRRGSGGPRTKRDVSRTPTAPAGLLQVVGIGASTGGTTALHELLGELPPESPGIVIVQHMPAGFTKLFAERLNEVCGLDVKEAETGDLILPGRVLVAPGNRHLSVRRRGNAFCTHVFDYDRVGGHRPSVDVLFSSLAENVPGDRCAGVLLTGMGSDGARGLKDMRGAGARTIAQDEASSVVYGMPRAAVELGAAEFELPLERIAGRLRALMYEEAKL